MSLLVPGKITFFSRTGNYFFSGPAVWTLNLSLDEIYLTYRWYLNRCVLDLLELLTFIFQEKTLGKSEVPVGIFTYPVLQAADILLYR